MTYQAMSALYFDLNERNRMVACVREQGMIFSADPDPANKSLGQGVVAGKGEDIDAVIMAVCVGPNWDTLSDDGALLAAVQSVWPTVAAAFYPQTP